MLSTVTGVQNYGQYDTVRVTGWLTIYTSLSNCLLARAIGYVPLNLREQYTG